ncbi:MAG: tetratricopeptide repeat protein [Acidobacteria bacterium]|nr:tetratricopeptide repeat protein [Acidobacteriota bacterium]
MMAAAILLLSTSLSTQAAGDDLSRLRAAHRSRPDDPQVASALGLALYQRDNASPEAQGLLEAAAPRLPKRHDVQIALLDSYLATGSEAAAGTLLSRLDPELGADERFALDTTYCLLGRRRFPEARTQWSRVARRVQEEIQAASSRTLTPAEDEELKRRVAEVLFIQGLLTARLGQKDEALRLLQQADGYGFPPLDSPLMVAAADCLFELQEYSLASQAYAEVTKHEPGNLEARLRLGVSLYSSGKLDQAREELEQVLRRNPGYPSASYYLGAVLLEQKHTDQAQAQLERELERDPRCARCMAKLAHLSYMKGEDELCRSWLQKAAALDPNDLEQNLVSGMLEVRTGRYEQAIQHLTRVVEQLPSSAMARYQLALAYQRSGNAEKAGEHLEVYNRLIQEEKARTIGVRGTED